MLKQTVNKNNIHVPIGVSQVSQLVGMILLINDCYVVSLVVIISRMNFVLYRNNKDMILSSFQVHSFFFSGNPELWSPKPTLAETFLRNIPIFYVNVASKI